MNALPPPPPGLKATSGTAGFTLVELLVVIALIAGLTAFLLGDLAATGKIPLLRSAQATVSGTLAVARMRAIATGRTSRLMLNIDAASLATPPRFLRYLVLQTQTSSGWQTVTELYLPDGIYFVPGDFTSLPAGLFFDGPSVWVKSDGITALRSTAFRSAQIVTETIHSTVAEQWVSFSISGVGTTGQAGDLVLALGRPRAPGSYAEGESPIELYHHDSVCGVTVSAYGLAVSIEDRSGF
ncbi:MAG TPA: prepilin-type N-terminal cleavage/methylation domain-containing protein [Opitutus sp.]|nr:prepilin-type N-terminal cleavage/methylation domain-containing protein [Opitutus sp.]